MRVKSSPSPRTGLRQITGLYSFFIETVLLFRAAFASRGLALKVRVLTPDSGFKILERFKSFYL